jgi:hypothetical protein
VVNGNTRKNKKGGKKQKGSQRVANESEEDGETF